MEPVMGGTLGLVVFLFLVVLGIFWLLCLPFAIFGTKSRLDRLVSEQRRTNELLERMAGVTPPSEAPIATEERRLAN
jgi:hypothetical protein